MAEINDASILHDGVLRMKHLLASGITDPISASRSSGYQFVMTSYPERKVEYPIITIKANQGTMERMGMQSEMAFLPIIFTIDVWSKKTKERDELSGSVFSLLRQCQYGKNSIANTGSGTVLETLYDFRLLSIVDFDEPGKEGIHRKMMTAQYKYITG